MTEEGGGEYGGGPDTHLTGVPEVSGGSECTKNEVTSAFSVCVRAHAEFSSQEKHIKNVP